ncbi:DUF429 domain-containing protein [Paracoccus aminovorans]|uniref:DUF429 domain-containing protein n=1 Tax=Paracoccus aminovorans TaxID=34004 RepID=UPI002B25AFB8|nr:DUF429 domain-containing protein [Paracoccus aminovorans]
MKAVLGIDAAWTAHNPSGLALATQYREKWSLHSVWPSYANFLDAPMHSAADLPDRAAELCGRFPDLVAVDMPLSDLPITGRRAADRAVSRAYGGRAAATHSPSALRPGLIADRMRQELGSRGYGLRHSGRPDGRLAEVYPHPALIELLQAPRRLPYKIQRAGNYWPGLPPSVRRAKLRVEWARILDALENLLPGTRDALAMPPADASIALLKSFEDQLDAVICAAVAVEIVEGRATAYGDATAAVWIPTPRPCTDASSVSLQSG